jgi:DNA-binding NtrC family response regulator
MPALFGNEVGAYPGATEARAGWLEQADGGTLVIDGLEVTRPALATAIAGFLDRGSITRVGASQPTTLDVRVVVVAGTVPHAGTGEVAPALAAHLGAIVRVPALRARPEDIPLLIARRTAASEPGGRSRDVDEPLLRVLLAHPWPGNVRELSSFVRRACDEIEHGPLRLTPELAAYLGAQRELAREPRRDGRASIARSGAFFTDGDGRRVDFATRRALRNVLASLAESSRDPAKRHSVEELFAAGWPGERASATAAASRVYVALATLRREGLKDHVQRDDGGYFLDVRAVDLVEA